MAFTEGFTVYRSRSVRRNQRWRWRLVVAGNLVAESGEGYANKAFCEQMGRRVISGEFA